MKECVSALPDGKCVKVVLELQEQQINLKKFGQEFVKQLEKPASKHTVNQLMDSYLGKTDDAHDFISVYVQSQIVLQCDESQKRVFPKWSVLEFYRGETMVRTIFSLSNGLFLMQDLRSEYVQNHMYLVLNLVQLNLAIRYDAVYQVHVKKQPIVKCYISEVLHLLLLDLQKSSTFLARNMNLVYNVAIPLAFRVFSMTQAKNNLVNDERLSRIYCGASFLFAWKLEGLDETFKLYYRDIIECLNIPGLEFKHLCRAEHQVLNSYWETTYVDEKNKAKKAKNKNGTVF
jgi:hypothetical protein